MKVIGAVVFSLVFLGGCAGIPAAVDLSLSDPQPGLGQVQSAPEQHRGQVVRWGGIIISVENSKDSSLVEVVARSLQSSSRPDEDGMSPGRFLIVTSGFLDPEIFKPGQSITVAGALDGTQIRKVGEYEYHYPVIRAQGYHLWAPRPERTPPAATPIGTTPGCIPGVHIPIGTIPITATGEIPPR